ncbi:hypothetical protein CASFOL_008188 [Castilleja foliolosa]|uniref:RanBD1 domain-containing protein n=1 Tax=Castilleja foliolosa TaxID=1961234 RepID=A0ABD3DY92_9LAMI
MRGTKRSATSDSTPVFNSNDSFMQSKRAIMGSLFDGNKAETSIRPPPLDEQRAESSRQHVRALNTQFASWVQTQLQDHPDELWEDGLNDYLNHAKSIMEKFSDVVSWLKANAVKGGSSEKLPSDDAQTKPAFEIDRSSHKLFLDKPMFPAVTTASSVMFPAVTTASSGTSWKSGSLFSNNNNNNNAPFSFGGLSGSQVSVFGNANAVTSNHDASNEADGEDDVERPSSPSLKKSQEQGIVVVHEVKCKLYVKSSDPADKDAWKDKGMGQLSIKCKEGISKGTKESKPAIIIRNDVGKVLLNALIYPGIKTNVQKNAVVSIFHTSDDGDNNDNVVARTFLMRTKTEEDRDKLAAAIQEYAPSS